MTMTHPGLPLAWGLFIIAMVVLASLWALLAPTRARSASAVVILANLPIVGGGFRRLAASHRVLFALKLLIVTLFLLIIAAGLFGTPIPERNIATVLTWNLWWAGLVFSVFFLGSAWCAVCPWDALAQWLVRRRLWRRAQPNNSLNLRVPRLLQNVWPALLLFIALTWLELGVGITVNPYATALVALLMVVLATVSLAVYRRKAFCRYFCPVGRTVGFYSQLAPVELRPIDPEVCANCKTLDCYHGNDEVEPCPTWLVMGRLNQNSYCTSCGNCTRSCPSTNVAWRLRGAGVEATQGARSRWDEAWFMIGLLALTAFHGITMMPFWETWMSSVARAIGDSGQLLWSFSIGLVAALVGVAGLYALLVVVTHRVTATELPFKRVFATFAFVSLPLAFAYHMAHNLNHLLREGAGVGAVFRNPLGLDTLPLSMAEKHARHLEMLVSQDVLFALQTGLMIFGFVIAIQVVRHRGLGLLAGRSGRSEWRLAPMLLFAAGITMFHLWLLMQPMVMRM
jgi:polyferredoxin